MMVWPYRYRHPNLVMILGVCILPACLTIIYELLDNGSLYTMLFQGQQVVKQSCITVKLLFLLVILIKQHHKLGDAQMRLKILYEAATGLAYLHSQEGGLVPVLHLDVKR